MINPRGLVTLILLALLCLAASQSHADPILPRHQRPSPTNCKIVRDFVAMVGEAEAERLAKDAGASENRIKAGRQCLKEAK